MTRRFLVMFQSARPSTLQMHWRDHGLVVLLILMLCSPVVFASDLNSLIKDAVRYANTSEKHAAKVSAREELKAHMPDAIEAAMEYVDGDNVMLQVLVMEWVRELPAETMVPALLPFVDHERQDVRRLAIFFLGFHDAPDHADRILPYLDDARCRGVAIRTLGKWKIESAREDIEKWLVDGKERVRVVAANALRDIGDSDALPALIHALNDPVFTVRNTAARAVVSFGEDAAALLSAQEGEMIKRCLADLGKVSASEVMPASVTCEGMFFVP